MASKLLAQPLTQEELNRRNQSLEHDKRRLIKSNKAHVDAILKTKKLFSPMTHDEQLDLIEWVDDTKIYFR